MDESRRRLAECGTNLLAEAERPPWWRMFLAQFQDFMVLVLLAATAISYAMGETADAVTIVVIVGLNAILGFVQEYRAESSLEALKQLTAPTARVRRDGQDAAVPALELVPGDLLLLEAGDRVPADARLLEAAGVEADESALTGESLPVRKQTAWTGGADTALGDRRNMLYLGTAITRGRGTAVVVETGMETEMGRIAGLIQAVEVEETPLQQRLSQLGKWLVLACLAVCALVVAAGLVQARVLTRAETTRLFLAGVSLAVAAIPEGLPAIVTVALALGVQRMIRRNAIVRRLPAVETLGCASVICSDKPGRMVARRAGGTTSGAHVSSPEWEPQSTMAGSGLIKGATFSCFAPLSDCIVGPTPQVALPVLHAQAAQNFCSCLSFHHFDNYLLVQSMSH